MPEQKDDWRLTNAETLLLQRRREGWNQVDAARFYNIPLSRYSLWERGLDEAVPRARIGPLADYERCLLLRRRNARTQAEVAEALGVCRWWLNQMERGEIPCNDLLAYWGLEA